MDAVIGVSVPLLDRAAEAAPGFGFGPERMHLAPYPVVPPALPLPPRADRDPDQPLVIGYCGRLVREQKRVERLPELIGHLSRLAIPYRFEVLGEGPERAWLEAQLPDRARHVFHGRKSGQEYWEVLRAWDVMVFVSDYEGTPIGLLEGLAAGVIPLHPDLHCGGDQMASRVSPSLVYPAGDPEAAALALQHLASWPSGEWRQLRERASKAVEPHLGDRYLAGIAKFLQSLPALPARSKPPFPSRPWPVDHLAFKTLDRISSLRRRMLGGGR
jgi:glycosyltransferase involved in cell wall biosynthesis